MDAETNEEVTIVVKSAYQNFPDQTICCALEWSVHQLKEEIMNSCPSHPSIKEQKLIYWGKLLEDKALLKDTLKIFEEGQANHTVHLILKNDQSQIRAEGLRKRTVPPPVQATSTPSSADPRQFPNMWGHFDNSTYYPYHPHLTSQGSGPNVQDANYNQQISAMQQAYVQYMQQYMQLMMSGGSLQATQPPFLQAPQPAHNPVPNLNNAENPAEERPRDWLDWFYLSSRALIFITIVCVYSSPFRFLLVLVIGFAVYLYQSGFFRYPGGAILIGDQQPVPPRAPAEQPEPPNNNNDTTEDNVSTPSPSQREQSQSTISAEEQPTLLGLTWSVVANFFASLLPDQGNII